MKLSTAFILLATLCPSIAFAECQSKDQTLFSCTTKNGKQILLCDLGKTIEYSFGKRNRKPEIVVSVPRSEASSFKWDGAGQMMEYAVNIPNGDTTYLVFSVGDRVSLKTEAGVEVNTKNGRHARILCLENDVGRGLEEVDLRPMQ